MTFKQLPTLFIQAALVATAAVLAIVLVTKYVAPIPLSISQTTTQKDSAFVASGKSSITTQPDQANLTLGVTTKEANLKTAQSKSNTVINALTKQLTDLGIAATNIKTENYSISPNYDYTNPIPKITGYSVDISIDVTLKEADFDKLNQVVDLATAAGVNQVSGVSFTLSDQKQKQILTQARQQAIDDAKQNASELARLSGFQLGKVINVAENPGSLPEPMPMYKAMSAVAPTSALGAGAPTTIQPGSTLYNYSVTLSYETL